jgi:hypothetical protein
MTTKEAIDHFGGVKPLAQALDIWPTGISRWKDRPPMLRQYEIERITKGKLKAQERHG